MSDKTIPVKVAIRCRPFIEKEINAKHEEGVDIYEENNQVVISSKTFAFDYVFGPDISPTYIYDTIILPNLKEALDGYNLTVIAYGQTGSGKTHTMGTQCFDVSEDIIGASENVGIIPKAIHEIMRSINDLKSNNNHNIKDQLDIDYRISVSFLEIYKEEIIDLLNTDSANLKCKETLVIREDPVHGIKMVGLKELPVSNFLEALSFLEMGSAIRSTASTAMNSTSSRSHAIFTMNIEKYSEDVLLTRSKIHFVDLAGSERVKKTLAEGERFKEGVNINRGLLALGNVINALSEDSKRKNTNSGSNPNLATIGTNGNLPTENGYHIPYRDSKLTRILQDSLGGNSHTILIACISPSIYNVEETLNTLRYADRARKIKNKPVINMDPIQEELLRLRNKIKELQEENDRVKRMINNDANLICSGENVTQRDCLMYKAKLDKLAQELQNYLDTNSALENELDIFKKENEFYKNKISSIVKTAPLVTSSEDPSFVCQLMQDVLDESTIQREREEYLASQIKINQEDMPNNQVVSVTDILLHVEMDSELKTLSQAISDKEILIKQMQSNESEMSQLREKYQREIEDLQKEKDTLNHALSEAQRNKTVKSDLSEKRRKRLQELETKILAMQKKLTDHDNLIKLKEQNKVLIEKLKSDITELKQNRVKLMRKMKEEGEKFRKLQVEKDKIASQFRSNMRKKEVQLTKLESKYQIEQRVLKRKNEEILANNKRLMEALAKRQRVQNSKLATATNTHSSNINNKDNRFRTDTNLIIKKAGNALIGMNETNLLDDREINKGTKVPITDSSKDEASEANTAIEKLQDDIEILTCVQLGRRHITQLCSERMELINRINAIQDQMEEYQKKNLENSCTTNNNDNSSISTTTNSQINTTTNSQVNTTTQTATDENENSSCNVTSTKYETPVSAKDAECIAVINKLQEHINTKSQQISNLQDQLEEAENALNLKPDCRITTPSIVNTPTKYNQRNLVQVKVNSLNHKCWERCSPAALSKIIEWLAQFALDKNFDLAIESQIKNELLENVNSILNSGHVDGVNNLEHTKYNGLMNQKIAETEKMCMAQQQKIESYENLLREREQQIACYADEFERMKHQTYPTKMFTPVGVRVKKNPRKVPRISNRSSRHSRNSSKLSNQSGDCHQQINETFSVAGTSEHSTEISLNDIPKSPLLRPVPFELEQDRNIGEMTYVTSPTKQPNKIFLQPSIQITKAPKSPPPVIKSSLNRNAAVNKGKIGNILAEHMAAVPFSSTQMKPDVKYYLDPSLLNTTYTSCPTTTTSNDSTTIQLKNALPKTKKIFENITNLNGEHNFFSPCSVKKRN